MDTKYSVILRNTLDSMDIKQSELARQTGITKTTISNYINAKKMPQLGVVEKIADVLNVSVDYLLGRTDKINFFEKNDFVDIDFLSTNYTIPNKQQKELIKDLIEVVLKNNKK